MSYLTLSSANPETFITPNDEISATPVVRVVNPKGARWALERWGIDTPPSRTTSTPFGTAHLISDQHLVVIEEPRVGYAGSLVNVVSGIESFGLDATQSWKVLQNAGPGSRLEPLSGGNKGHLPLPSGESLMDFAERAASAFEGSPGFWHICPTDMIQRNANQDYPAQLSAMRDKFGIVLTCIPIVPDALTPDQLAKWGFAVVDRKNSQILRFVEHPKSVDRIHDAIKDLNADVDIMFSTFRFHISPSVAYALRDVLSGATGSFWARTFGSKLFEGGVAEDDLEDALHTEGAPFQKWYPKLLASFSQGALRPGFYRGENLDFSDIILEGATTPNYDAWHKRRVLDPTLRNRYDAKLWEQCFHLAKVVVAASGGLGAVSCGATSLSEDVGTIQALRELFLDIAGSGLQADRLRSSIGTYQQVYESNLGESLSIGPEAFVINSTIRAGRVEGIVTNLIADSVVVPAGAWLHGGDHATPCFEGLQLIAGEVARLAETKTGWELRSSLGYNRPVAVMPDSV